MGGYVPNMMMSNVASQQFATVPSFNFPGGSGPGCAPCGGQPFRNLPEQQGKQPNTGCNPTNPSRGYNPNPYQQPPYYVHRQPPGGYTPPGVLPNLGQPLWQQPQQPSSGLNPLNNCNKAGNTPEPVPTFYTRLQPYQPFDKPPMPSCYITNQNQMPGLPVQPAQYIGWNNTKSAQLPYQNLLGTGMPPPPQMMYLGAPTPIAIVRPQPLAMMRTVRLLPSELCPLPGIANIQGAPIL